MTLIQVLYAFFNGMSGQTLLDSWVITVYNLFFTSWPILIFAIFERDLHQKYLLAYPELYNRSQLNKDFNLKVGSSSFFPSHENIDICLVDGNLCLAWSRLLFWPILALAVGSHHRRWSLFWSLVLWHCLHVGLCHCCNNQALDGNPVRFQLSYCVSD